MIVRDAERSQHPALSTQLSITPPVLPLRDITPRRTTPVVNVILIIANVWIFLWEVSLGPNIEPTLAQVAFIPARFWYYGPNLANIFTIFVSMFLHGGWLHLGGNMLY